MVHLTPSDRGVGLSGAQLLNNLQLNPPALLAPSPFRGNLVHLDISGCQSINTGAIDTLLRLSHANLPKLQRIHMEGLRLELCQRAAKSFLRERLGTLDSLGTMGAFTLGQNGRTTTPMRGRDLSAKHLLQWLKVDSKKTRTRLLQASTILNIFPGGPRNDPYWTVPFHHSANLINMPQAGMFRHQDGTLQVPQSDCTLDGVPLKPEDDPDDMLDLPLLTTRVVRVPYPTKVPYRKVP
mmetsp:Transcript_100044/g.161271  ORF Transcript_100044/g.161271 Transcript_100044/m.161271 type:complete len:238 (+) Transcript_100044:1062-1775(+)